MNLYELVDPELLERDIQAGYIRMQQHPKYAYRVYNYTAACQFARAWDDATSLCRGLIVNSNDEIIARPFQKFFNYTEIKLPRQCATKNPLVFDKADGSLGIVYPTPDGYAVATRGSFISTQAQWATMTLRERFPDFEQPKDVTTLVEIVYPQNRIVVDYGDTEELFLLASTNNRTGADIPFWDIAWWPGDRVSQFFSRGTLDECYRWATTDERATTEGIVCVWYNFNEPAFRLKIKHPEYVRIHRLVYGLTKRTIWDALRNNTSLDRLLEDLPNEFYDWVINSIGELRLGFKTIEDAARNEFDAIMSTDPASRKDFAAHASKSPHRSLLYNMYDNKDYSESIWKALRPEAEGPELGLRFSEDG